MTFIALIPPPFVDVTQYGAVGDGATDSTTFIANALAAIPTATGGTLYFPPATGAYITSGLNINSYSNNLNILGGGWGSVIKLKNASNSYIIFNSSNPMQGGNISNIAFDCNSANQTGASGAIYGYQFRRCMIDSCYIHDAWQSGIYLQGTGGGFGYQNKITRNFILNGNSSASSNALAYGTGLWLQNTDENVVAHNHFEQNGNTVAGGTYPAHIYDANGLTSYTSNSFVNGSLGIKLDGLQCRIITNIFDGVGGCNVQINGAAHNAVIIGNTFLNPGYQATGGSANSINCIYANATQTMIQGNYFQAAAGATPYTKSYVNVDAGATYSIVEQNLFNTPSGAGPVVAVSYVGSHPAGYQCRFNDGYDTVASKPIWITENHGTAVITSGNASVVVTHGLNETPSLEQISVTPQTSQGSATQFWVSTPTSTTFTINMSSAPGVSVTFGWRADTGY